MARSILSQALQIGASSVYDGSVVNVHTVGVAEGQVQLEGDLNVLRSLLKNVHGEVNWYDIPNATISDIVNKKFMEEIHVSGFDGVTIGTGTSTNAFDLAIKTITGHNSGAGSSLVTGVVLDATKTYKIIIQDSATQNVISDGSNNEVYGRLVYSTGTYTINWYSNISGIETAYNFLSGATINIGFVAVSRRFEDLTWGRWLDPEFHDVAGLSGTLDDANVTTGPWTSLLLGSSTAQQVFDKVDKLGSIVNGEGASGLAIEDVGLYYTGTNIENALTELSTQIGGADSSSYNFTENNLFLDNDPIYTALNKVDLFKGDLASIINGEGASLLGVEDAGLFFAGANVEAVLQEIGQLIQDVSGWDKQIETNVSPITSGANHTVPGGATYTLGAGANLDIYFSGQLLVEGLSNDYQEVSTTQVKFNFTVPANKNLTYMARK